MNTQYIEVINNLTKEIEETQSDVIEKVSDLCTEAIKNERMLFFFGTGHSHMICEEPFYRAGGLIPVYPILEPALMLHEGAYKSTFIERIDGIGKILIQESKISKGDILFLVSNSGRNNAVVEMAIKSKKMGITTVTLTSLKHSRTVSSRHKSGKKLYEIADYVIDNCGIPGDAAIKFKGLDQRVAPTSSMTCILIVNIIVTNIIEKLLSLGITPPVFMSSNTDEGDRFNKVLIEKYRSKIKIL